MRIEDRQEEGLFIDQGRATSPELLLLIMRLRERKERRRGRSRQERGEGEESVRRGVDSPQAGRTQCSTASQNK